MGSRTLQSSNTERAEQEEEGTRRADGKSRAAAGSRLGPFPEVAHGLACTYPPTLRDHGEDDARQLNISTLSFAGVH